MQSLSPELSHKLHNGHLYLIANTPTWESSEEFIWTGKSNIVAKHRLDPDDISIQLLLNEIRHKIKLHKWKGIRQLSITIPVGVVLTDKSLDRIGRGLRDCLPDLVNLNLKFQICTKLSSIGAEALGLHIGRNLPHLKSISISMIGSKKLRNGGLDALTFEIVSKKPGLKHLSLDFEKCKCLSDRGVSAFAYSLERYLPSLEDISLDFNNCPDVTSESFEKFLNQPGPRSIDPKKIKISAIK